jgi:hypothetical protein
MTIEQRQRISGRVTDRLGAAVPDARVVISAGPEIREATTDKAGAYLFEGVQRPHELVRMMIKATHPTCGTSLIREVPHGDASVDLQVLGSGRINGVVEGFRNIRPLVIAQRVDEPVSARVEIPGTAGDFRFEDVPPGDYVVSLEVPKTVETSGVNVRVVNEQTAIARLVMVTSSVRLRVKVPVGRGKDLVLVPLGDGAETPEPRIRKVLVMRNVTRSLTTGETAESETAESVSFDYVLPGTYKLSINGKTWTSIVVTLSPDEQSVEISAEH